MGHINSITALSLLIMEASVTDLSKCIYVKNKENVKLISDERVEETKTYKYSTSWLILQVT